MTGSAVSSSGRPAVAPRDSALLDASCRWPVLFLLKGAALWLVVSSIFGLIASLKFHRPDLASASAALSYGRAYGVWASSLVYGFGVPAALAVSLWIIVRLGAVKLCCPVLVTAGAKLWHLGVFFGLIGILRGSTAGYEWFELPRTITIILLGAFFLMAVPIFVTHSARENRSMQPAQWFALGAAFWFPWIFSTAILLLQCFPVRGVTQATIAWWFGGNLLAVWLPLTALAGSCYLIPKLARQPLQSNYTALFAFLTLVVFGSWTGIQSGVALPAWMPALSGAASLMLLIPALAIATMLVRTVGQGGEPKGGPLCFARAGAWSLVLALVLMAISGTKVIARITDFTWYAHGHALLRIYGCLALTLFGAAYHLLPRVTGVEISPSRVRLHFWLAMPGALLMSLPLVISGIQQGLKLADPKIEFLVAAKAGMMMFRLSTLGEVLFGLGALVFCLTTLAVAIRVAKSTVVQACATESKLTGSEVRA